MSNNEENKDKLLNSNYDGIQEYDNDLPRWWVNIFWLTSIYAVFYVVYVHFGFKTPEDKQLAQEMAEIQALTQAKQASLTSNNVAGQDDQAVLAKLVADNSAIELGKSVFTAKCAVCHSADGGGLIGPNLTDDYWIHGGSLVAIKKVIQEGVLDKGMLAWKATLPDNEINSLVAYIHSLRGTKPATPKEPQGEIYKE